MGELILGIMFLIFANVVLNGVIGFFKAIFSGGSSSSNVAGQKLKLKSEIKTLEQGLKGMLVNLHGVVRNPTGNNMMCVIKAIDITEPHEKKPIFCNVPNWSDDDNVFISTMDFEAPYAVTEIQGSTVGLLPLSILDFPRKGRRQLHLFAVIFSGLTPVATVEQKVAYNNDNKGYLDIIDAIETSEITIAKLAVAVSAIDGTIDQIEKRTINRYFETRFEQLSDPTERKTKVLTALRDYSATFNDQNKSPYTVQNEIAGLCQEIANHDNDSIVETAFQLAIEVISSDNKIENEEKDIIDLLKLHLGIDEETAVKIEDRYIKIDQFIDADDESKLGMPANLSDQEKKTWLSREYGKWKNRVTHSDPVKSKEASDRLELITRCRNRISA